MENRFNIRPAEVNKDSAVRVFDAFAAFFSKKIFVSHTI